MGLGFRTWNFQGVSHNFAEVPGVKVSFLRNFQGQGNKSKNSSVFFKNVYSQPLNSNIGVFP